MAAIKSVSMRRRENGKIYLSGYVDGLETGYNYCIVYSHDGGPVKNVGRNGMSYTFIGLSSIPKGTYRKHYFSDTNSWVPDDGDGTYKIICNMVGSRCEDIHILESAESFSVTAPTPTPALPTCIEGETVCEYNAAYNRYLLMKCVGGKMVFNRWCGKDDTCEDGVCISPPKPECTEGDKKAGYVCVGGKWQPAPAVPEPVVPPVTPPIAPPEYLTPEDADERIRAGLPCYIKCVLPILDMLPGIPYTRGAWVPPFCAITSEP